jgi:hypothetical protein
MRRPAYAGWHGKTPVPLALGEWQQPGPPPRPFRPHPYQQLAKVLRERGQEADAQRILIGKEKARLAKDHTLSRRARWWQWFLGRSMAYGYRPQWLLLYALIPLMVGWGLFAAGDRAGLMVPSKAEAYPHYERNGQLPPFYPPFRPLLYSLDTLLPIINLGQKDYWWPRDGSRGRAVPRQWAQLAVASSLNLTAAQGEAQDGGLAATIARAAWATIRTWVTDGEALRLYRLAHITAGWLLITLGVAGVTGLVRNE